MSNCEKSQIAIKWAEWFCTKYSFCVAFLRSVDVHEVIVVGFNLIQCDWKLWQELQLWNYDLYYSYYIFALLRQKLFDFCSVFYSMCETSMLIGKTT